MTRDKEENPTCQIIKEGKFMQELKEKLPVMSEAEGSIVQGTDWGDMKVSYMQFAKGMDASPLLEGLPDNMCPCPHWGYMLKGKIRIGYKDGREEIVEEGQLYYMPPGHTMKVEEDTEMVEFSPIKEMNEVLNHIASKLKA